MAEVYKKYVQLDDGSFAQGVVPVITSETMATSTDNEIAYVILSNGLWAKAIVPIDENGDIQNGFAQVDETDTVGDKWAWVVLDDGTWAEAVVCVDADGNVI